MLLLKNGLLVRSQGFHRHQIIGNPIHEVQRFNEWSVDELIYLDISQDDEYDLRRDDQRIKGLSNAEDILTAVSENCFIPLTWGGRIRTIEQIRACFQNGADKVSINTAAVENPGLYRRQQRFSAAKPSS